MGLDKGAALDLELITERIMQIAQAAVAEHMASISRSQADGLMELAAKLDLSHTPAAPRHDWN